MVRLLHVVNPVLTNETSELGICQPLVFQSMLHAKQLVENQVELLAIGFAEDEEVAPASIPFQATLTRSLQSENPGKGFKKLPFLQDILTQAAASSTQATHIIYTNADIIVQPAFYQFIVDELNAGVHDALLINRRRLPKALGKASLSEIWAHSGRPHPGFDCFVFPKEWVTRLAMDGLCLGVPFVGVGLAHNLFCMAQNPKVCHEEVLTKHLGLEVLPPVNKAAYQYNKAQFKAIQQQLKKEYNLARFPYAHRGLLGRMLGWGLNPSLFIADWAELEGRSFFYKTRHSLNEWRWLLLEKLGRKRR